MKLKAIKEDPPVRVEKIYEQQSTFWIDVGTFVLWAAIAVGIVWWWTTCS
jgi:hypothetical protein